SEQISERFAPLHRHAKALGGWLGLVANGGGIAPPRAQQRDAAVARDGEQPGLEVDRLVAAPNAAVSSQEGVLNRIVGVVRLPEQVPAEQVDRLPIAVIDLLERPRVPSPHARDEPLVGHRLTPQPPRHHPWRRSTHVPSIAPTPDPALGVPEAAPRSVRGDLLVLAEDSPGG